MSAYISSAYWFMVSMSFANPAWTFAKAQTATFAGIESGDVAATALFQWLMPIAGVA